MNSYRQIIKAIRWVFKSSVRCLLNLCSCLARQLKISQLSHWAIFRKFNEISMENQFPVLSTNTNELGA